MGSWKKLIMGEPMPDKEDPKYKAQYEKEVATGRKVAEKLHLSKPFIKAQEFANKYPPSSRWSSVSSRSASV